MLTATEVFLAGAAAVAVLLGTAELTARTAHYSFVATVILGQDNRTSTSKTFIFMWTLLVGWALTCLLIAGELINIRTCAAIREISTAFAACTQQHDRIGLMQTGWRQFLETGLADGYLVLLGVPVAAAVAAKGITQAKDQSGAAPKTIAPHDRKQNLAIRAAQVFSADDQTTDIGDFQYMLFNLVAAAYFVAGFMHASGNGLPDMPGTLLGLTSVSAALYVAKKAAAKSKPTITGIFPSILLPGEQITVTGTGLTAAPNVPFATDSLKVQINGRDIPGVKADPTFADQLTATLPADLIPEGAQTPMAAAVQVLNPYGIPTDSYPAELRNR
jgi:hypothetical protein